MGEINFTLVALEWLQKLKFLLAHWPHSGQITDLTLHFIPVYLLVALRLADLSRKFATRPVPVTGAKPSTTIERLKGHDDEHWFSEVV